MTSRPRASSRTSPRLRAKAACSLALAASALIATLCATPGGAASSTVTVTATVPSATNLSATGCVSGSAAASLGTVLPGTSTTTSTDCIVVFGSSNDTSMLRLYQADGAGSAMYRPPAGPVDGTFNGGTGRVFTPLLVGGSDESRAVAVQSDGKVVVASNTLPGDRTIVVTRHNQNGTVDAAFGTRTINPTAGNDSAYGVAIQPDGKIIVAGGQNINTGAARFLAWRLNSDGSTDLPFGGGTGIATVALSGGETYASDVHLRPDGRIVLVGSAGTSPAINLAVAQLTSSGALDTGFGAGTGTYTANLNGDDDYGYSAQLQPDGMIVASGWTWTTTFRSFVTRIKEDGSGLDTGFGVSGQRVYSVVGTGFEGANSASLAPDGSIVVGGQAIVAGTYQGYFTRLSASGTVDPSFGTSGFATLADAGGSGLSKVKVQMDGRIVAVGSTGSPSDTLVERRAATGAPDLSFNGTGRAVVPSSGATADTAHDMEIGEDGRYIMVGYGTNGTDRDMAVQQLLGLPVPQYGGGNTWATSHFGACLHAVGAGTSTGASTWTPDATCGTADGAWWKPVVATGATAGSKVATSNASNVTTSSVGVVFGLRTAGTQAAGTYIAPVVFETIAPAV